MVVDGFDEDASHAAVCAGDGDFERCHVCSLLFVCVLFRAEGFGGILEGVAFGADEYAVFKIDGQVAAFFDDAVAGGVEGIVPAVGMESVAQYGAAEQEQDLVFGHAGAQGGNGARFEFVALDDFEFVGGKQRDAFDAARGQAEQGGKGEDEGFVHGRTFLCKSGCLV